MLANCYWPSYNSYTMFGKQLAVETHPLHQLWLKLSSELASVFDAHYVCATIASEITAQTSAMSVVGIRDLQQPHYNVWICRPDGELMQQRWPVAKASFEPILEAGCSIRLKKLEQSVTELINSELWILPKEDLLAVPFPYLSSYSQITPPGVLCLIDADNKWSLDNRYLDDLSRSMTVYLDRAFLRLRVDQQAVEFDVLSDIGNKLTSTLSMDNVFQQLSGTIRRTLHVESLSVGLSEAHTGDIVFVEQLLGSQFDNLAQIRVKRGQGIAGWVAEHGEPVIVNDTYADKRFYAGSDRRSGFKTNSMLCIPLQVEQQTIGVLQAINRQYGEFTNHDLQLLQAIGGPLAAAIENARLHTDVVAEKQRVETLFASMSDGVLTITKEGLITRANEAFGALLLNSASSLSGEPAATAVRLKEGNLDGFIATVLDIDEEHAQMIADLLRDDGSFVPVLISGAPIWKEKGKASEIILTFSDLSQVREVERMREDLFQAVAHELRTPLATILMYARLLREGKARDKEKAARFLGVIERESDRLQRMVRRMMQLARQEASELQRSPQAVYLSPMLEELLPPLADQAVEKGLLFRQKIEPNLPPVLGEREQLEEIFGNLVVNAIKFTPAGSVSISATANEDHVIIEVSDKGIGIPQEALPNLFKRFYRTQTAVERGIAGTGLGLYMVKRNVENYNGTITVSSSEDEGTTFTVTFPVYQE